MKWYKTQPLLILQSVTDHILLHTKNQHAVLCALLHDVYTSKYNIRNPTIIHLLNQVSHYSTLINFLSLLLLKEMVQRVLNMATEESDNPDLRDRYTLIRTYCSLNAMSHLY